MNRFLVALASLSLAAFAGCNQSSYEGESAGGPNPPAPHTPVASQPAAPPPSPEASDAPVPPADSTVAEFVGMQGPKPASWIWHPPQNRMYHANWTVPGEPPAEAAHLVIFYFGPDQGGSHEANISRWKSQWRTADQQQAEPEMDEFEANGMKIITLKFEGEWMRVGTNWFTPDQAGLFAIVESPSGSVYVRLAGDAQTVLANADAFDALLRGLTPVEGSSAG